MVGLLGRVPYLLAARPDLPQATLGDVVALRDARGATPLSLGNIGPGSMIRLIGTQFAKVSRVPVNHVPYKGVPPLVQDLLGSQLDLAFVPVNGTTGSELAPPLSLAELAAPYQREAARYQALSKSIPVGS